MKLLIHLSAGKRESKGNSRGPIRCQRTRRAVTVAVEEEEEVATTQLFPSGVSGDISSTAQKGFFFCRGNTSLKPGTD